MKNNILKKAVAVLAAGTMAVSLAACGNADQSTGGAQTGAQGSTTQESAAQSDAAQSDAAQGSATSDNTEKTKIIVATTGTGPSPFIFQGDDGNLDGYDIAVIKEIFSRLPQYELEFQTTEFASIFTGIDAGYYQMGVNNISYNKERGEKYLFSDVYSVSTYGILVRDDNTDIQTLDDLPGHTTETSPTSYNASMYQSYNEAHPDAQIEVSYIEDSNNTPLSVSDGKIDFELFSKTTLQSQVAEYGLTNVKIIDVPIEDSTAFMDKLSGNFFVVSKEYPQLVEDINTAFEAALEEGRILEISKQYLGDDADNNTILNREYIEFAKEYIANDQAATN